MHDGLGWLAAGLMLGTFACRDMLPLRCLALAASAAFVAWGWQAQLMPVLALHAVLLPIHVHRLVDLLLERRRAADAARLPAALPPVRPDGSC